MWVLRRGQICFDEQTQALDYSRAPESGAPHTEKPIAGYSYLEVACGFSISDIDLAYTMYVKKLDGYMISVVVMSGSSFVNEEVVDKIVSAQ